VNKGIACMWDMERLGPVQGIALVKARGLGASARRVQDWGTSARGAMHGGHSAAFSFAARARALARRLFLVWFETACSVPRATEDLICRVEGAPALDLGGP
jgi:hypothetical protein